VLGNCYVSGLLNTIFETIHFYPKAFESKFGLGSWKVHMHQEERAVIGYSRRESLNNMVGIQVFPLQGAEGFINASHGWVCLRVGPSIFPSNQLNLPNLQVIKGPSELKHKSSINSGVVLVTFLANEVKVTYEQPLGKGSLLKMLNFPDEHFLVQLP
jgi:hypothetical protein